MVRGGVSDKSIMDEQASKALKEGISRHAKGDLTKIRRYLLRVIKGEEQEEQFDQKRGMVVSRRVSHSVRVQAAKVFGGLLFDKILPDKKDTPQKGNEGFDLKKALEEVAKSKKAEKKAASGGKVISFSGKT